MIECDNCAGVKFRLAKEGGNDILRLVQLVSVPFSDERIPVDDDTPAGSLISHGGKQYTLKKEFSTFSLEAV